ncbi:hypothetical protein SAMN06297129_2653 [Pseudooceanicola antarcticus]|uniref:Uncharacterized protein n=1 Tax=Pseudooceanicola antarcticus TaxID=1247613 RepID=A0A285J0V7_9RHOB|nr:hypothetical protein [Pseudooceanicola antarcticus]PJE29925.1 hypothetical protein CVM39_08520 [Pseudooceanicola antarcticus]SNY53874.1 hypothetical protein SAMN06297129_2653 [Pseudooceanicola antarcticus]
MFGIVLWRAADDKTAVVWCEDHGDLAFLRSKSNGNVDDGLSLDPGDLLQFDLTESEDMRLVENPRLVAEDHYPSLAGRLMEAGNIRSTAARKPHPTPPSDGGRPIVVPFPSPEERDAKWRHKTKLS